MTPPNWPKHFTYAPRSISNEIHPHFLEHLLATGKEEDLQVVCPHLDEKRVHPAIQIEKLSPPHPLADKEVFAGHPQHGLFAKEPIPPGTFLGEYVGEIQFHHSGTSLHKGVYCWAFLVNDFVLNIDSKKVANELAFVNDYRGIREAPNLNTTLVVHRGLYYFGYLTTCEIQASEELLIDYGASWERGMKK